MKLEYPLLFLSTILSLSHVFAYQYNVEFLSPQRDSVWFFGSDNAGQKNAPIVLKIPSDLDSSVLPDRLTLSLYSTSWFSWFPIAKFDVSKESLLETKTINIDLDDLNVSANKAKVFLKLRSGWFKVWARSESFHLFKIGVQSKISDRMNVIENVKLDQIFLEMIEATVSLAQDVDKAVLKSLQFQLVEIPSGYYVGNSKPLRIGRSNLLFNARSEGTMYSIDVLVHEGIFFASRKLIYRSSPIVLNNHVIESPETEVEEEEYRTQDDRSLPDFNFQLSWPRKTKTLQRKYGPELRHAFSKKAKKITSIKFDIPEQIRSLYPGTYLDSQVIHSVLWKNVNSTQSGVRTCVVHPDHSRDMSSLSPQTKKFFREKNRVFSDYELFLFPYHLDENHWIMLAFDRPNGRFFVADSLSRSSSSVNSYANEIEIFSKILRDIYSVKNIPETHPDVEISGTSNEHFMGQLHAKVPQGYTVWHKARLWKAAWRQEDSTSCGIYTILFGLYFAQNYQALDTIWNDEPMIAQMDNGVLEQFQERNLAIAYRKAIFQNVMVWCLASGKDTFPLCYRNAADDIDQMYRYSKVFG